MNRAQLWSRAKNILCVRLDGMGDVLMTTPALRALRESTAGRRLTLLTSRAGRPAGLFAPVVNQVMVYEAPWMKSTAMRTDAARDRSLITRLKAKQFDAAVIFTVYSQNPLPAAFLCHLAGIPLRLAHCRENPYQLLTDWIPENEPQNGVRHEVQRQLDLVQTIGCATQDKNLSLDIPLPIQRGIRQRLQRHDFDPKQPWVVIHPGAAAPSRRYPPENFARLAGSLTNEHGWQVIYTGSASERPLIEEIRAKSKAPSLSLAGRLGFGELAALIGLAPILISNNTGPAHIAAATGTPVIDLYALTNPQHQPWGVPHRVLFHDVACKYCYKSVCPRQHHDCLRKLRPEDVVAATLALALDTVHFTHAKRKTASCAAIENVACIH